MHSSSHSKTTILSLFTPVKVKRGDSWPLMIVVRIGRVCNEQVISFVLEEDIREQIAMTGEETPVPWTTSEPYLFAFPKKASLMT